MEHFAIVLILFCLIFVTYHAFGEESQWQQFVKVGSYWNSEPEKSSQFFKIPYRIMNGTIDKLETNNDADVFVDIKSDKEGEFEIKIPKNFPYTNYDFDSRNYLFDILINDVQADTSIFQTSTDCYYLFSLPFRGNSQIKFSFNADYQSENPWYGDEVDQKCTAETIVDNLKDKSSLIPIKFTYPKIVQDYDKGIVSLPIKDNEFTKFSTSFRTTFNGYVLPYQPKGETKKELTDDNFQEFLKRNGSADLVMNQVFELKHVTFKIEQERELAKLLQDADLVEILSGKINALGQQIAAYDEELKKLQEEMNLIEAFNISIYKMSPEKEKEYGKAQIFLTEKYMNKNAEHNFINTIFVDTIKETLIIGVNVDDKSIDEKQYIAELSGEIKKFIGNDISFEIEHMVFSFDAGNESVPKTLPPYQQFKQGTALDSTKCDPPLELHIKGPTKPICIKPETYEVLVNREYPLIR